MLYECFARMFDKYIGFFRILFTKLIHQIKKILGKEKELFKLKVSQTNKICENGRNQRNLPKSL